MSGSTFLNNPNWPIITRVATHGPSDPAVVRAVAREIADELATYPPMTVQIEPNRIVRRFSHVDPDTGEKYEGTMIDEWEPMP